MNAVSLLCEIIAQGGRVSASFYRGTPAFIGLAHHGFLRQSGVVDSVVCYECDVSHAAQVAFLDKRYGYHCPDLGFVALDQADIRAVKPDLPWLVKCLADTFECVQRKPQPLQGETFRIGAITTEQGSLMVYFQPCLESEEDARDLERTMFGEVHSRWKLIITARGTLQIAGARSVRLDDLVEFNAVSGDFGALVLPADLVGVPFRNPGGAPNLYGKTLSELIKTRISDGTAFEGRNAEARAVLSAFTQENPNTKPPSLSSVQDYVTKVRSGQ